MSIKLLATGNRGQIAQALSELASSRPGIAVVCVGRPRMDLDKLDTIDSTIREFAPDVVVSTAAYTAVVHAEDESQLAMRINGDAAGQLAAATRAASAKLIHLSTDYVYDGTKPTPYVETDAVAPQSVYGHSKLVGEQRVHAEHPEAAILRTAWVYSSFGRNFAKTMLDLARTRDNFPVVDDQLGNPTSAHDIADAILAMVECWRQAPHAGEGSCSHCAGTGETTWDGFARHVFETSRALGGPYAEVTPLSTSDWLTKAIRPANSRLDCTKFSRDFGWRAPEWHSSTDVVLRRLVATL